jgi:hypothetical protein
MNTTTKTDIPTRKETLFTIGESFYALESLLIETDGEITDEIDEWLQEYQAKEDQKVDAYCYLIQKFESIAAEAKRLAERAASYNSKVRSLKDRLKIYMELRGRDRIETPRFTVSVCGNGGLQPIELNDDVSVERLPEQFVRTHQEPDMNSLRDAILSGDEEAMRFASVQPRGTHLRIK